MKTCKKCSESKQESEFDRNNRGIFPWCKLCRKAYDKERYERVGSKQWRRTRGNGRQNRKIWFQNYKKSLSCSKCPENHPACLDFHHVNEKTKTATISNMVIGAVSEKRILAEISKCIVLCANCHRKFHYEQEDI